MKSTRRRRKSVPQIPKRQLNKNIIDQWPEIFSEVDLGAIPIPYLHSVLITFKDGRQWNVILKPEERMNNSTEIPKNLSELFENYENQILNVDFRLDVEMIKKDIIKATRRFTKRKKKDDSSKRD